MKMANKSVSVTLDMQVHDEAAFRLAARNMAEASGDDDPERFLQEDDTTLGECAQMLYDPGEGHPGSTVMQSTYEDHRR